MGRIVFPPDQPQTREYRPYSRDETRHLQALYLGPETSTGDDPAYFDSVWAHFFESITATSPDWLSPWQNGPDLSSLSERFESLHNHAHGWFHLVEMHLLNLATRISAQSGKHAVEIGSYQGRSTAVIAAALGDCGLDSLVLSLDPNELAGQQAEVAAANVASVGQRRRLVQIHRPAAQVAHLFADQIAHLAFIDGSHDYPDVLADFHLCDRLLIPGGMLVFHDVYSRAHLGYDPPQPAPAQVIEQVVLPSGRYEPIAAAHVTMALRKKR